MCGGSTPPGATFKPSGLCDAGERLPDEGDVPPHSLFEIWTTVEREVVEDIARNCRTSFEWCAWSPVAKTHAADQSTLLPGGANWARARLNQRVQDKEGPASLPQSTSALPEPSKWLRGAMIHLSERGVYLNL